MAVRVPQVDYYSLHGIWGAYASLALGRLGKGAGIVVGDVRPPDQALYIGYGIGSAAPWLLPFSAAASAAAGGGTSATAARGDEAFRAQEGTEEAEKPRRFRSPRSWFPESEIERYVSLSGEEWRAGSLSLRVVSFFGEVPDPASAPLETARARMRPSLLVRLSFDNSAGAEPMTGIFALRGIGRPLSDASRGALLGAADGRRYGFAARPAEGIEEIMDWDAVGAAFDGASSSGEDPARPLRRLASEGGLRFRIRPGERREFTVALGVFREGVVTAGIDARAYHSRLFKDLEEVLMDALAASVADLERARELDAEFDRAGLGDNRAFLLAHAAHCYAANTELLAGPDGAPFFVVNEGEYRMMNTLDLTVDQAFWEARFTPWTLRNVLESFAERYSYEDSFGLAFTHDQGVADCFSPRGRSSYEMPGLTDCFSYMTYEETLNWSITACLYASLTGDLDWARSRAGTLSKCIDSLLARDVDGDGIMDRDSDRCSGGAEITTYDSLDISLGQARNNLYLAVKAWSAYVCLEALFKNLGGGPGANGAAAPRAATAAAAARAAAASIAERLIPGELFIPAVFESDNRSRIIPAVEGLAYPGFCGASEALREDGPYGGLVTALKLHLDTVLAPGVCLDAESGGWKLSSTSRNTWLSKIFLNQYVAEKVLGFDDERTRRDAVHARWLRSAAGSAEYAATDQVDSATGKDLGSRLYPRLVTSILWLLKG